jgi:hypothetical protein
MQRTHVLRRAMPPTAGAADSGAARVLHVRDVDRRRGGRSRARGQLSGPASQPHFQVSFVTTAV